MQLPISRINSIQRFRGFLTSLGKPARNSKAQQIIWPYYTSRTLRRHSKDGDLPSEKRTYPSEEGGKSCASVTPVTSPASYQHDHESGTVPPSPSKTTACRTPWLRGPKAPLLSKLRSVLLAQTQNRILYLRRNIKFWPEFGKAA
jgi:hypothetical protein